MMAFFYVYLADHTDLGVQAPCESDRENRQLDGKGVHREVESGKNNKQTAGPTTRTRIGGTTLV